VYQFVELSLAGTRLVSVAYAELILTEHDVGRLSSACTPN